MEHKKRSKCSIWEFCYANKIFGKFGFEIRASGQKLVTFCAHAHAAQLVVEISSNKQRYLLLIENVLHPLVLHCYLVPSSRGRLLVIPMTIFLQASRYLVKPHSSVSGSSLWP